MDHFIPAAVGECQVASVLTGVAQADPDQNPETEHELPAETTEPDETETEATKGGPETPSESEPPA